MYKGLCSKKKFGKILNVFPVPKYLKMPTIGLSIGTHNVRVLELDEKKQWFEIKRYGELRFPDETISSGVIINKKAFSDTLRKLKDKYKFKYVKATLPEEKAYLFNTEIPYTEDTNIRESVEFKIEENVPIPANEAVFDCMPLDSEKEALNNGVMRVSVSVLPRDVVETYIEAIKDAGILPVAFAIESHAIAKAVVKEGDSRSYFILSMGKTKTGLYVVSDGVVQFTSTLSVGSDDIVSALELKKGRDSAQKRVGSLKPSSSQLSIVSDLREEIKKVYTYWITGGAGLGIKNNTHPRKIEKMIICGRGANDQGVVEYVSASLPISSSIANVWVNVFSLDNYIPEITFSESLSYVAAVGLALPDRFRSF